MTGLTGRVLANRYRLDQLVSSGAAGEVYQGADSQSRRKLAIKLLRHGVPQQWKTYMQAVASLDHPNIVQIFEADYSDELRCYYIVMSWIPNGPLDTARRRTLPESVDIIYQLANALQYAHVKGLVHRDINDRNILMDDQRRPVLVDFAVPPDRNADVTSTDSSPLGASFAHLSPEQCQGGEPTRASDQYSLAIVAYQLLSGELPFNPAVATPMNFMTAHISEVPPAPQGVPAHVAQVVLRALAKNPAERFPTIMEFGQTLERSSHEAPPRPAVQVTYVPGAIENQESTFVGDLPKTAAPLATEPPSTRPGPVAQPPATPALGIAAAPAPAVSQPLRKQSSKPSQPPVGPPTIAPVHTQRISTPTAGIQTPVLIAILVIVAVVALAVGILLAILLAPKPVVSPTTLRLDRPANVVAFSVFPE